MAGHGRRGDFLHFSSETGNYPLTLFSSMCYTEGNADSIGMCGLVADFLSDEGKKAQEYFVYFKLF